MNTLSLSSPNFFHFPFCLLFSHFLFLSFPFFLQSFFLSLLPSCRLYPFFLPFFNSFFLSYFPSFYPFPPFTPYYATYILLILSYYPGSPTLSGFGPLCDSRTSTPHPIFESSWKKASTPTPALKKRPIHPPTTCNEFRTRRRDRKRTKKRVDERQRGTAWGTDTGELFFQ